MNECKPLGYGDGAAGGAGAGVSDDSRHVHGRAVQGAPMKPQLKPPGTQRLKLNCDILLSTSAFKFNLRRYNTASLSSAAGEAGVDPVVLPPFNFTVAAGAMAGTHKHWGLGFRVSHCTPHHQLAL